MKTDIVGRPLPPSLAVVPNIEPRHQAVEQLQAEHDYWDRQIREASGWGAGIAAADGFRRACAEEMERRK